MIKLKTELKKSSLPDANTVEKLMVLELSVGGHYPEYIAHLIDHWQKQQKPRQLVLVVSPLFLKQHRDVVDLAKKYQPDQVIVITISAAEYEKLKPFDTGINRNLRAWQEFQLLLKYARKFQANHVFIPYFDTLQIALIFNKSLPFTYSGIYFRPSFYYDNLVGHHSSRQDKFQHWREKITLSLVLKKPELKTLFCLDSWAIKYINQLSRESKAVYLPDPVQIHPNSVSNIEQFKSNLGIEASRQVHLLAGGIGKRKGLDKILDSICFLNSELCQRLCFLVVGPIEESYYQECLEKVRQLTSKLPIQIIFKNQHILETEIQKYFQICDVVLAPYQRHVGMSAILTRAAIARKPVLAPNYGLMGEITRRYRLGIAINSTQIPEIAEGLTKFLTESPTTYCDFDLMQQYAEQNTPEKFTSIIFQHI
ncbi:MAG: glycosyltransferase [Cyanobacteria bacterium P01_G01_bin.39]